MSKLLHLLLEAHKGRPYERVNSWTRQKAGMSFVICHV